MAAPRRQDSRPDRADGVPERGLRSGLRGHDGKRFSELCAAERPVERRLGQDP